jgi:hypothetical protein
MSPTVPPGSITASRCIRTSNHHQLLDQPKARALSPPICTACRVDAVTDPVSQIRTFCTLAGASAD